jgi:hypothetical protein
LLIWNEGYFIKNYPSEWDILRVQPESERSITDILYQKSNFCLKSSLFCALVLLITKERDLNIVEITHFSDFFWIKTRNQSLWFIFIYEHIANQNSVRFSVSIIFYKICSSKCKQSICLHYGLDFHFNLYTCILVWVSYIVYLLYFTLSNNLELIW